MPAHANAGIYLMFGRIESKTPSGIFESLLHSGLSYKGIRTHNCSPIVRKKYEQDETPKPGILKIHQLPIENAVEELRRYIEMVEVNKGNNLEERNYTSIELIFHYSFEFDKKEKEHLTRRGEIEEAQEIRLYLHWEKDVQKIYQGNHRITVHLFCDGDWVMNGVDEKNTIPLRNKKAFVNMVESLFVHVGGYFAYVDDDLGWKRDITYDELFAESDDKDPYCNPYKQWNNVVMFDSHSLLHLDLDRIKNDPFKIWRATANGGMIVQSFSEPKLI